MELLQGQIRFCQKHYLVFDGGNGKPTRTSYMGLMDRFAIYPPQSDEYEDILTQKDLETLLMPLISQQGTLTITSYPIDDDESPMRFDHPLLGKWNEIGTNQAEKRLQEILEAYKDYCKSFMDE
jgi:hypothetical protein